MVLRAVSADVYAAVHAVPRSSRAAVGGFGAVTAQEAAGALWSVCAGKGDQSLVLDWQDGSRRETSYFPIGDPSRFERMVAFHVSEGNDPKVGLVPRRDRHLDNVGCSSVMWASIENPVGLRNLDLFHGLPKPTLLFGKGRRRIAVWWLDRELPYLADPAADWLTRGNKRLAYALKANSRHALPEWLMPVWDCLDADPDRRYSPSRLVGKLKDAPVRLLPKR